MIICQYDITSDNFDLDVFKQTMKQLEEKFPNETFVAMPSGLSISEWSDEDGLNELERTYNFLGEIIAGLKETIGNNDKNISNAIKYMDICSTSPYYQDAWKVIKEEYGIERE